MEEQAENGHNADLQPQVTNSELNSELLKDHATQKPEVEFDAAENEIASSSRSMNDAAEIVDSSTGMADSKMTSSSVEMESSCSNETGETVNAFHQSQAMEQSDVVGYQSAAVQEMNTAPMVEQPLEVTDSFSAKPEEEEPQSHKTSSSPEQPRMESGCHEGEMENQIQICSESFGCCDAVAAEDDAELGGMASLPNQLPETSALNEQITLPEPEVVINAYEAMKSPGAQLTLDANEVEEQMYTMSTMEAGNEELGTNDEGHSPSQVHASFSHHKQNITVVQSSELPTSTDVNLGAKVTLEDRSGEQLEAGVVRDRLDSQSEVRPLSSDESVQPSAESAPASEQLPIMDEFPDFNQTVGEQPVDAEQPELSEVGDQADSNSHLPVLQRLLSQRSAYEHAELVVQTSPQLHGSCFATETSEDPRVGVTEQPAAEKGVHIDESSAFSEPINDVVDLTSPLSVNNTHSKEVKAAGENAENSEEDRFRPVLDDSPSPDQTGDYSQSLTTPLSDHEPCSSGQSGTEVDSVSCETSMESGTFTFPEPPQHPPFEPPRAGDADGIDEVFIDHSALENDAWTSQVVFPAAVMTSSTTTSPAATESLDVSRQQRSLDDELLSAAVPPHRREDEVIPDQPSPTPPLPPSAESYEVLPAAAAAAAATAPAEDGDKLAAKSYGEVQSDELDVLHADNANRAPSSEACSEIFPVASQPSEATVRQVEDATSRQDLDKQRSCESADRSQLSLLIPTPDADLLNNDNQVGSTAPCLLYTLSSVTARVPISVLCDCETFLALSITVFSVKE